MQQTRSRHGDMDVSLSESEREAPTFLVVPEQRGSPGLAPQLLNRAQKQLRKS